MNLKKAERDEGMRSLLDSLGFRDLPLERVSQALTHSSYAFESDNESLDNERLEFLGDAVLSNLSAVFVFERFPADNEGQLSKKKGFLVSRKQLGRRAREIGLERLLLLGKGEDASGGRKRASVVGSALEALIGALSIEGNGDLLRDFVQCTVLEPGLDALKRNEHLDAKSRLQEQLQKQGRPLPVYRVAEERGPAHDRSYRVEAVVEGQSLGFGEGKRIKTAENAAAEAALEALEANDGNAAAQTPE